MRLQQLVATPQRLHQIGHTTNRRALSQRNEVISSRALSLTKSTIGTADEQTQASWRVPDVRAEVAERRARGVKVERYDQPGRKTDADGVADVGFAWAAWIIDPGRNALSILQVK